jgi:hypothetical protein
MVIIGDVDHVIRKLERYRDAGAVVSRFWWKRGVTFLPEELRSYST